MCFNCLSFNSMRRYFSTHSVFPADIPSLGGSTINPTSKISENHFDHLTCRIQDLIKTQSQSTSHQKQRPFFFRWILPGSDLKPSADDLCDQISHIFTSHIHDFNDAGLAISLNLGQNRAVISNQLYTDLLGKFGGIFDRSNSRFEDNGLLLESPTHLFRNGVDLGDDSVYDFKINRAKILGVGGEVICLLTQIEQIKESHLFIEAKEYMKSKHVLIVDDTASVRKSTQKMLQLQTNDQITCTLADDGRAAVELFKQGKLFDCVLMDLEMPMPGTLATESIRKIPGCAKIPIIAWTTKNRDECEEEIKKSGMTAYCLKHRNSTENLFILMSRLIQQQEWDRVIEF